MLYVTCSKKEKFANLKCNSKLQRVTRSEDTTTTNKRLTVTVTAYTL